MLNSEEKFRNKHFAELEDAMSIKIVIDVVKHNTASCVDLFG